MPRDLFSSEPREEALALVASPEASTPTPDARDGSEETVAAGQDGYNEFSESANDLHLRNGRTKEHQRNDLHPYVQTLSISNLEDCVALENAVFPEHERCSREKFAYRLTVCPELCLGLFSSVSSPSTADATPTYSSAHPPDSANPDLRSVLIAMIIATKIKSHEVTDDSMYMPTNGPASPPAGNDPRGHQEHGRTLAIHTLGVLPAYQGRGLAKMIMRSYEQRMETSGIADRIALLAHDHLVNMYERMGFVNRGKSEVKFGGGGWNNLVYEFSEHGPGP